MHTYGVALPAFAGFSVNAHANAKTNPNAMYRNTVTAEAYAQAGMVADPVNLFDTAPDADGAAAVLLAAVPGGDRPAVRIAASAAATEALALHDRREPLHLSAAGQSAGRAYEMAGVTPEDINLFELHDAYGILAAMSLEACGCAPGGEGWRLAAPPDAPISRTGRVPTSTFGGLKARGNPGGATGVYQAVEVALQLRGEAGPNSVSANGSLPRWGLAQSLGGLGATAVTHILERVG
jgi:acetyl-CoA C-acetyltransferase